MTATTTTLRTLYPEFADITKYPDAMIQAYLDLGAQFVNVERWDTLADYGVHLWTAHHLAIARINSTTAAVGGVPGGAGGILSSKSGGGMSAGYDFSHVAEEGAGYWNGTSYGREFYRLSQMMGIGPVQVGTDGGQIPTSTGWPGLIY